MNNFVTIKTFTYSHELALVRGLLESEGIDCRVQDELTVQVDPFYSNAIGGIKLQVKESDVDNAIEVLREGGYLKDEMLRPSKCYKKLDGRTSKIPLIGNLRFEFRLLIIIAVVTSLVLGVAYYATLRT